MRNTVINLFKLTVLVAFTACSANVTEKSDTIEAESDSENRKNQLSDSIAVDINQVNNSKLTNIYVQAIEDYMKAVHQKDKTAFDTLYFVKREAETPDPFPDIKLPAKINGAGIELLSFGEAHGKKIKSYKKTAPIINLFGWVETTKAEFIFVTFYPEFTHQYDCYINYKFNPAENKFILDNLRIEVFVKGKTDHFAVYKAGK